MKTIAIIAPTGMLGSMVYDVLKDKHSLVLVYRDEDKLVTLDSAYGGVEKHRKVMFDISSLENEYKSGFSEEVSPHIKQLVQDIGHVDGVINCAGVIKPYSLKDSFSTLFINGVLPHILSAVYLEKLIHITTDCVYGGIQGAPYTEQSPLSAIDLYGVSKYIGEPHKHSLVLRTSIIGPEIHGFVSLIEWLKKQEGKKINGFTNHYWNGVTTREFGKVCDKILSSRKSFPLSGLYHLHSTDVSKYEMLMCLKKKYNIDVAIEPVEHTPTDRRLYSIHGDELGVSVPSFEEMVREL
jgi:dTDP-4-dehydrorhamnose reductase